MTRRFDRIEYSSGRARRFIIVPSTSFMSDYVNKYGSDVVFRFEDFADAMSLCGDGRGDEILFAPGSYTQTAALTVNKGSVYIGPLSGNPYDVRIDCSATDDCTMFTIAAAGDYCTIEGLALTTDDSATQLPAITVGGVGCVINNCTFYGASAATAVIYCIDVNAADCRITNCNFYEYECFVDLGTAPRCVVSGNKFFSTNTAAVGVNCSGVCSYSVIENNMFALEGGTGDKGIVVDDTALDIQIINNYFNSNCDDPITPGTQAGNADTAMVGNMSTGSVAVDGTSATIANLPAVIYT